LLLSLAFFVLLLCHSEVRKIRREGIDSGKSNCLKFISSGSRNRQAGSRRSPIGEICANPRFASPSAFFHVTVDSLLAESDSLRLFLQEAVENADGMDVSVNEIAEAYATFCPEKGWNPLPITEIHRSLEGLMLELFRVTKSHSVERDGKSFRVTLK
jgi:hypothetical protein